MNGRQATCFSLAFLAVGLVAGSVSAQQWAEKMFAVRTHDFGAVARDAKAEFEFVLTNPYVEDIHIAGVRTSCGCTSVRISQPLLKTYQSGAIVAHFNTDRFLGRRGATVTVTIDRPLYATVRLQVKGEIHGDLVISPSSADLGTVARGTPSQQRLSVRYAGGRGLKIVGVESSNPHLKARIVGSDGGVRQAAYEVLVELDKDAPAGYIKDNLLLVTNDRALRQIPVMVEGRVLPEVTVSPATLFLGAVHPGQKVTKQLVVRGSRPFRITAITADGEGIEFATEGTDVPKPLHLVPVTFLAGDAEGSVLRAISIKTDISEEAARVSSYAVVEP